MEELSGGFAGLEVNGLFISFLGISTLIGTIFFFRWYMKLYPGLKGGQIINKLIIENRESVLLFSAALANFSEAMVSASIHPPGQAPINGFARFLAHGITAFIAIVCAIYFAQYLKSFIQAFKPSELKKDPSKILIRAILVFLTGFGMIIAPILNLFIVANGMHEVQNTILLLYEVIYPDYYLAYVYEKLNLPLNYNPFSEMSYVMAASVIMTIFHYIVILIDAFVTLDKDTDNGYDFTGSLKSVDSKINNRNDKEKEEDLANFGDSIKYLLIRANYKKGELQKGLKTANDTLDAMTSEHDRIKIAGHAAKLARDIKGFDHNERKSLKAAGKEDEIKKRNEEFHKRILKLFDGKTKGGDGLGMPLSDKSKNG